MDLPVNIYDPVSLRTSRAGCRACSAPARLPQASIVETGGPGRSPRLLWEQAEGTTIASLGHLDPAGCGNSHTAPRQPAIASDSEGWRACDIHGEARQATRGGPKDGWRSRAQCPRKLFLFFKIPRKKFFNFRQLARNFWPTREVARRICRQERRPQRSLGPAVLLLSSNDQVFLAKCSELCRRAHPLGPLSTNLLPAAP